MSRSTLEQQLYEKDPLRLECAGMTSRKMLWIAFPLRPVDKASYPYRPGQEITLTYYASFEKLHEPLVVTLFSTGAAYLYVPSEPKELVPLSGRFADEKLVRQVTGKPLKFFASYVAVAYNLKVNSLAHRKTGGNEYQAILKISKFVTVNTPMKFTLKFLT